MVERVRVTEPDGECGYGWVNDLRGLYGWLRNKVSEVQAHEHAGGAQKKGERTYGT